MTKPQGYCFLFLFCIAAVMASGAQSVVFTSLASFDETNGAYPYYMTLVQGSDGNFYGTTLDGGAYCAPQGGCGTIFKITPAGRLTTVHSFNGADGWQPSSGLILASDRNFYGTTYTGGPNELGTVFKITPSGTLTTLYSFCSQPNCTDGYYPSAGLVEGRDGNFYGTNLYAGSYGHGTVFKITPSGALTTLYSFCSQANCADGSTPYAGLVQASDGNFYGTTTGGGTNGNYGTIFKINPTAPPGQGMTLLYSFCGQPNCADGSTPYAPLMQARDGNFYGTTAGAGAYGDGTVFKMTSQGALTTLRSFQGYPTDGEWPTAGLVQGHDGSLYGTTFMAGTHNFGTVFEVTTAGTLTLLFSFDGTDGAGPLGGLVQAPNGFFYGTSYSGGDYGYGSVFRLLVVGPCAACLP